MGHGITVRCTNCGHEQKAFLGVGFAYLSLEAVIEVVPPAEQPLVLEILNDHYVESTDFEHSLYTCPNCHALEEHFYYRVVYDDGQILQSEYRCDRCGTRLDRTTREVSAYPCPVCGHTTLTKEVFIWWD